MQFSSTQVSFPRILKTAILGSFLSLGLVQCASVKNTLSAWFDSPEEGTAAQETAALKESGAGDRAPASVNSNPLRVIEYCVVDNFSRVGECYPSLELCQRAARGFGMCSGR